MNFKSKNPFTKNSKNSSFSRPTQSFQRKITPKKIKGKMIFPRSATELNEQEVNDWACSFQHAAVDAIMNGINTALTNNPVRCVVAGGGVLANTLLRKQLEALARISVEPQFHRIYKASKKHKMFRI